MKSYNYLNLQQKLCRIRKKIPALCKKRYSEEVDYDFTKIDDIYRFLTPALNKYGVNFEVYAEAPTRKDEQGNPVYMYQENGFWMYEADLKLRWVNADNPSECEEAVIHVVGTHEVAEKAKGTAWTYGLKYYLFSKFNIDQGGDDPDFHDFREETPYQKPEKGKKDSEKPQKAVSGKEREERRDDHSGNRHEETPKRTPEEKVAESVKRQVSGKVAVMPEKKEEARPENDGESNRKVPAGKLEAEYNRAEKKQELAMGEEPDAEETGSQKENQTFLADAMTETSDDMADDGFHAVTDEEIPFDEAAEEKADDFFQSLMDDMEEEEEQDTGMSVEEARKVICGAGAYSKRPLGEAYDAGAKGRRVLEWLVRRYDGPDKKQKEAARVLLAEMDRISEEKKAA